MPKASASRRVGSGVGWVCRLLRLDAVEGVAALGEVDQCQGAERVESAFDQAAVAELDRDRVDVGLGSDHVGGVQLAAGQGRVA